MTALVGTKARGAAFIDELARHGLVGRACLASGLSPSTAYRLRAEDPEFAAAWSDALRRAADELEGEARRRALHGADEPVMHKGQVVFRRDPLTGEVERDAEGSPIPLTVRRPSDRLMEVMLAAKRPDEFGRKRLDVEARVETTSRPEARFDFSSLTQEQRQRLREALTPIIEAQQSALPQALEEAAEPACTSDP
jgi:hypothetical protein